MSRYIFHARHFNSTEVKAAAFLPARDGETSVMRVSRLDEAGIWKLGADVIEKMRNEEKGGDEPDRIKARGDFLPESVRGLADHKLDVTPDPKWHPRHANILGWSTDKDAQKEAAAELALRAKLVKRP